MTSTAASTSEATGGALTFHRLRVCEVRTLTDDAVEVAFEVPVELRQAFSFQHGQHLTVRWEYDGEELRRTYSLTSRVGDHILRIGVRRVPEGRVSTYLTTDLRAGDELDVMTPAGRFTAPLEPASARHWLLIAAGSGITPIVSITKTVLATEPNSRVTLLYCNRGARSIMFLDELEDLKDRYLSRLSVAHFLSRERRGVELFDGRLNEARMRRVCATLVDPTSIDQAFICGPEAMSEALRDLLAGMGVRRDHLHVELFGAGLPVPPPVHVTDDSTVVATARVRVRSLESQVRIYEGERILDAARRVGLDVPFACTGGVCATCRAHVSDGDVEMASNHALEPAEVAAGFTLTCQATPCTDTLFVDYDHR